MPMRASALSFRRKQTGKIMADLHKEIDRGMELLRLCQALQSQIDGVDRPAPGVIDKAKTLDQFAADISNSLSYMAALHKLMPMKLQLAELGRKLEAEGKFKVATGEDYDQVALDYLLADHGMAVCSLGSRGLGNG